ncbi:MAG: DUF6089 family protein [Bacteroidia bacterium]
MKKYFLAGIIVSAIATGTSFAQSSEASIMLGISSYKGDISNSLFNTRFFHPAIGVDFRRCINNNWSYRLGIAYGSISGDDAKSDDAWQLYRNLSFKSNVLEAHWIFDFNFFPYQTANPSTFASPFVFAGLAVYKFNPKAPMGDDWIELQPLGTEGQGTTTYPDRSKYNRVQVSLPFGGGFKFKIGKRFGVSIEAGARRTFTDHLDDVSTTYAKKDVLLSNYGPTSVILSDRTVDQVNDNNNDRQRGDAAHKDWYMFAGVSLNFTLSKKYADSCRPFKGKWK